jgi:chaperonin GroES
MKKTKKKAPKKSKAKKAKKVSARINNAGIMPLGDRVLIKRAAPEEITSFGIIIPDTAKEKSEQGVVVTVGPGRKSQEGKLIPVSVSVGDKVRFSYGDEVKIGGIEYILVHENNILAILK